MYMVICICSVVCVVSVMGHVVYNAMQLVGLSKTPRVDPLLRTSLDNMSMLAANSTGVTRREQLHARAIQEFAEG